MLEIRSLSLAFGGVHALNALSLSLGRGEMLSIMGPNGCGKTTLLNALTGQVRPQSGTALLDGVSLLGRTPDRIARLGVGRKFQVPSVFDDLSVLDNLRVAQSACRGERRHSGALPALADVLQEIFLQDQAGVLAGELSHGAKQWLEIGLLLSQQPRLMLLDEPTAGMSQAETLATVKLLQRLQTLFGVAIVVVEHDMHFIEALGARVLVMIAGRAVADGSYAQVRSLQQVREAYLGTQA